MAAEHLHSPTPEEVMEFVDGEGTPAARAGIEAHLAACPACQTLVAEQRGLSRELGAWQVAPAPESLKAPANAAPVARPWWRPTRFVLAGLSAGTVVLLVGLFQTRQMSRSLPVASRQVSLSAQEEEERLGRGGAGGRPAFVEAAPRPETVSQPAVSEPSSLDSRAGFAASLSTPKPEAQEQTGSGSTAAVAHGPAVIRTATLQLVAKDFNSVRTAVDVILDSSAGFADQLGVSADPGSARVLRGTLRVPGTQLTGVLTRLRALGQVTQDQQNAQDVADQLVDLDARLRSARATEQRLIDLLKNRTGKLSDVLEVEQELTRVRLDIERLDAEKTNMTRRVAYATIDLTISEERQAAIVGPLPLLTQLRVAAKDGLQNVIDMVVGLALFVLRAGPTVMLAAFAGILAWIAIRRALRVHSA